MDRVRPAAAAETHAAEESMKLEGVIVCDRYHDFLAETLPHHRSMFDRLAVVTSYEDRFTCDGRPRRVPEACGPAGAGEYD